MEFEVRTMSYKALQKLLRHYGTHFSIFCKILIILSSFSRKYLFLHYLLKASSNYLEKSKLNKTDVINDPFGQIHSHASSEHCFLLFCVSRFEKVGTDERTDNMCENNDPYGRDFGLAEWISISLLLKGLFVKVITDDGKYL